MSSSKAVKDVYLQVVVDVINGVREAFLDEGMDEQVLLELKQLWETKLNMSKALEVSEPRAPQQTPQQHTGRATAVHQHQAQLHAAAVAQTAPLQHINPQMQLVGIPAQMTGPAQAASSALPAGLFQQIQQQRLQHSHFDYRLQPAGGQPQQQQLLVPGTLPSQFTLLPATQTEPPVQLSTKPIIQLDGLGDSSSEDENRDDDDDEDDNDEANDDDAAAEEEDPLNSGDDVSDADPTEVFDAENVIVCQFDKINRSKNKWKFHLKDGIMNVNGRDQLFAKANGDAEW